jgi:hypothetical protein
MLAASLRMMSILPLTKGRVDREDRSMKAELLYESPAHGAAPKQERPWVRFLAGILAPSLDRRLAAGRPPQSGEALAIGAREVITPAARRELALCWANVLDRACQRSVPRYVLAPLQRSAVIAAREDLRVMIAVLAGGSPISARGAAMASSLLTDGTGPLYNSRSLMDLGAAVREATRQLDPFAARPAEDR